MGAEDREKLAKAIVAAADLEFSQFKDHIQDTVEQRFKDRIGDVARTHAARLFNPDAEIEDEELEDDDLVPEPVDDLDPDELDTLEDDDLPDPDELDDPDDVDPEPEPVDDPEDPPVDDPEDDPTPE